MIGITSVHAVDLEVLRRQLRESGAEAALDAIVDTYLESVPPRVQILRDALTSGTPAEIADAAHGLKSSAGAIGARPLAALLGEIEAAGRADSLNDRAVLGERVTEGTTAVLSELRGYRFPAV